MRSLILGLVLLSACAAEAPFTPTELASSCMQKEKDAGICVQVCTDVYLTSMSFYDMETCKLEVYNHEFFQAR